MNYTYPIGLALANNVLNIDLADYISEIKEVIIKYNDIQKKTVNHKKLILINITKKEIILKLYSEKELQVPSKALRSFSQIIIDDFPELADKILYHKHLFRSFPIYNEKDIENSKSNINLNIKNITEKEVLKAMIELCLNDRTREENKTLYQIKEILYNKGLC